MKIGIFLRNLDEILSEFHEHLQKMSKFAENCRKFWKIITQGRLTARRSDTTPQHARTAGQEVRLPPRAAFDFI